mgnify:CR=1 FL=1
MSKNELANIKPEDIVARECRHVTYCPPKDSGRGDLHVVKEMLHLKDGRVVPNLRKISNYQRPFWITKKGYQNHNDKKESEEITRLQEFRCTQTDLVRRITMALDRPGMQGGLRQVCRSPYVYGADILAAALIKQGYMDKWPETNTPYSVSYGDTETDVVHGTEEILMATLSWKERVYTVVQASFVKGFSNVVPRLQDMAQRLMGDVIKERNLQWEFVIANDEADVVMKFFEKAHEWGPDFLAIWNIDFDIPRMIKALTKVGIDPAQVLCDPSIPPEFRYYEYKQGPSQKVTAEGKVTPIKPAARWHTLNAPAKFYVIDGMCAYKQVRTGQPEQPSYGLDAILTAEKVGINKLDIEEAKEYEGLKWHQVMQTQHQLEYIIYNGGDCICGEKLDEKINDLSVALPMLAGCSVFDNVKSQPRRTVDMLHTFMQKHGHVIGTTSNEMSGEMDELTVDLKGWIVMLPAHQVADNGICVIEEIPDLRSNIRRDVGDLDVSASYPNGGEVFNISKHTTSKEIIDIIGVTEYQRRMQGVNLSGGHTNAVEICTNVLGLPALPDLLHRFKQDRGIA